MKIGLISINMYSKGLNFACPLHTYAFQQFLKENGVESTVINYQPIYYNHFDLKHPADYYERVCADLARKIERTAGDTDALKEKLNSTEEKRDSYKAIYREREVKYEKFQNFIEKNYVKTDICYNSDLLEVMDPGFDCYICVTDVIWKKEPGNGFDRGFFLASKAMENKWKIAYAASRGVDFAETKEDEEEFFHYVNDIDKISVREESLKHYIEEKSRKKAEVVLDPVLLHKKDFYEKIAVRPEKNHYLFLYYVVELAEDTIRHAVEFAKNNNLRIVEVTDRPLKNGRIDEFQIGEGVEVEYRYDVGVEEWLGYIMDADYVFTNSFHCSCLSILFEKEFYVGSRHGDKISNLLTMLGIGDRRIPEETAYGKLEPFAIDYRPVEEILEEKRKQSSDFVLSFIREIEGKQHPEHSYKNWKKNLKYWILYNSKAKSGIISNYTKEDGIFEQLPSGSYEITPDTVMVNQGRNRLMKNRFQRDHYAFMGWYLRIRIDKMWFWYMKDGTLQPKDTYKEKECQPRSLFSDGGTIPYIPVNHISLVVAEAVWIKEFEYKILYNCGAKSSDITWKYEAADGEVKHLATGSYELSSNDRILNTKTTFFKSNKFQYKGHVFVGWRLRVRIQKKWFWYLNNEVLYSQEEYKGLPHKIPVKIFEDRAAIPPLSAARVDSVVAEAVWKEKPEGIMDKVTNIRKGFGKDGSERKKWKD